MAYRLLAELTVSSNGLDSCRRFVLEWLLSAIHCCELTTAHIDVSVAKRQFFIYDIVKNCNIIIGFYYFHCYCQK